MDNFDAYSKYYDLLYREKNYQQEAEYVSQLIQQYKKGAERTLELGCGSGSHAKWLTEFGYQITGIERSREMIEIAKSKRIRNFSPIEGDISSFALGETFEAAFALFHVISYLTETKSLIETFNITASHLESGGIFIFDVWYSPAVLSLKPETRIRRLEDNETQVTRLAESTMDVYNNRVDVNYEVFVREKSTGVTETFKELHSMRHFSVPEIDLLARHTGFRLLESKEFNTGLRPSENTWGVGFVLQKI